LNALVWSFGLSAFLAKIRIKEIGIRKVLGASVVHLWSCLSKDFIILVGLSAIIASAFAYNFWHGWLAKNGFRIIIGT
jgi:putative ABC transport system permease protein